MKLQSIISDRKQLHKTHSVQLREKNRYYDKRIKESVFLHWLFKVNNVFLIRQMQTLMRMEHMLATATERLERTRSIYNELQAQVTDPCVARFETYYHGCE